MPRGRIALALPGLAPAAEALVAWTVEPMPKTHVVHEPAAVLHAVRFSRSTAPLLSDDWFGEPNCLESAAALMSHPSAKQSYFESEIGRQARTIGRTAAALVATVTDDPKSRIAALLAPLGWYALAATEPQSITPDLAAGIGRKLARRWQLPNWLTDVLVNLTTDGEALDDVADEVDRVRLVRSAIAEAEHRVGSLGIVAAGRTTQWAAVSIDDAWPKSRTPAVSHSLLPHLLKTVATARRRAGLAIVPRLETENEVVRAALDRAHAQSRTELHDAKLESLAEFAAGAGHEINNPLAVISGHCQRLMNREGDPEKRAQLGTVIRQTMRIHGIVRGLMQFARPPKPHRDVVAVPVMVEDVIGELNDLKADAAVAIDVIADDEDALVTADAAQVKTILHHVLRNAIEAAGTNGRVDVTLSTDGPTYRIEIEDTGLAPTAEQREHLFDPFFSGRSAGRGRGLGLSIAWRLARVNGGDVVYAPTADGTTRFVLTLPLEHAGTIPIRRAG
jgi:signal transduction histidine kinase